MNLSPLPGLYSKCSVSVSYCCYLFCSHQLQCILQVRKLRLKEINWFTWLEMTDRAGKPIFPDIEPGSVRLKTQCCWDDIAFSFSLFYLRVFMGQNSCLLPPSTFQHLMQMQFLKQPFDLPECSRLSLYV